MFKPRDNLVSVGTGQGPYGNIRTALSKIDLSPVKGKKVLVKPNAGRFVEGGQGITTHPDAVAAVIDTLREADAASITLGESPILGVKTLAAFEKTGIAAIADKTGVPLLDMDKRKPVIRQVKNGRVLTSLKFCAAAALWLTNTPLSATAVVGMVLLITLLATEPQVTLFILGAAYVLSGPLAAGYRLVVKGRIPAEEEQENSV